MKMLPFIVFGLSILSSGCEAAQTTSVAEQLGEVQVIDVSQAGPVTPAPQAPYTEFLNASRAEVQTQSSDPNALLYRYIQTDMLAYWDETKWDFNGTSRVPGEGDIACGYFVTTLLQDLGFSIARIRMAQEPSATMINKFTSNIKIVNSREAMVRYVETQPVPGVYIVGLDFHTGFITSGESGINFVHSNYIGRAGVMTEPAAESDALAQSGYFMIGSLTENTALMNTWRQRP